MTPIPIPLLDGDTLMIDNSSLVIRCIQPNHGYVNVIIDREDLEKLGTRGIRVNKEGYVLTRGQHPLLITQLIVGVAPLGLVTDHINRNKLDNRKLNLRFVPELINAANRSLSSKNTSGYKGVAWHEATKSWYARYQSKQIDFAVNGFSTALSAALAYDAFVDKYVAGGTTNKTLGLIK